MIEIIRPGLFTKNVMTDERRGEFDCKNETLVNKGIRPDFLFAGDSITKLWELVAFFTAKDRILINRGIGGDETEYFLKRFNADVVQLKPKFCITMIGVNDAWKMEYDPWMRVDGEKFDDVLENAAANIEKSMGLARQNRIPMAMCSVMPTNMQFTNHEEDRKRYVVALNKRIKEMCEKHGNIYVDYFSAFVKDDGLTVKDGLTAEGIHPNVNGYNIMAEILRSTLSLHGIEI
jgi:lysophospholipase L1-like esterase